MHTRPRALQILPLHTPPCSPCCRSKSSNIASSLVALLHCSAPSDCLLRRSLDGSGPVFDDLVSLFLEVKNKRQVIRVTRNANLVVNTDAWRKRSANLVVPSPDRLPFREIENRRGVLVTLLGHEQRRPKHAG